jgi:hypothetical protein
MSPTAETETATLLDQDHLPETNGRMAVCRRCGSQTDGPGLHHLPAERQMARIQSWLVAETTKLHVQQAKEAREH